MCGEKKTGRKREKINKGGKYFGCKSSQREKLIRAGGKQG